MATVEECLSVYCYGDGSCEVWGMGEKFAGPFESYDDVKNFLQTLGFVIYKRQREYHLEGWQPVSSLSPVCMLTCPHKEVTKIEDASATCGTCSGPLMDMEFSGTGTDWVLDEEQVADLELCECAKCVAERVEP